MSPDDIGTILWCMAGASACDQRAVHAVLDARKIEAVREALESGREYATERLHEHDACYRRHPATEAQRGEMTEAIATIDKALALLDAEAERSRLELDGVARMTAEERNAWLDAYAKESEPPAPTCPRTAGPVDASPFTSDGNEPPATQSHDGYLADMIRQDGYFGLAPVAEKALAILGAEAARDGDCKPQEWDALTKKEMWDTIQSIRVMTDTDGTVSPEAGVEWLIADRDSWHELASKLESEVARLREALENMIEYASEHLDGEKDRLWHPKNFEALTLIEKDIAQARAALEGERGIENQKETT